MDRYEALRRIQNDEGLRDEILTRVSEDHALVERVTASVMPVGSERPPGPSQTPMVDAVRSALESPDVIPGTLVPEAIIKILGRPVLLVKGDDYDIAQLETETWKQRLETARPNLSKALRSIGRIDLDNNPQFDWVGTGWLVAEDIVVTNRHVASVFAQRTNDDRFVFRNSFLGDMGARLDFAEEFESVRADEVRVVEVLHIEDDSGPDMAFVRVDWSSNDELEKRAAIPLATQLDPSHNVAVMGYPAKDSRTSIPDKMDEIFGDVYNVKRLAPGEILDLLEGGRFLTHDCTTLGGNSGSVVLDIVTGEAAGLHFAGRERVRNFAVSAPVVRARLEQLQETHSLPRLPVPLPDVGDDPIVDMDGRDGYNTEFLGVPVAHPGLSRELQDVLAPVTGRRDGILDYTHYSVLMHSRRRLAMYTAVNIDGTKARNVRRGNDNWRIDSRIDREHQVDNELYKHNKLDRGHLVRRLDPAWGDSFDAAEIASDDTFFYTNCAPQHKTLNQQLWLGLEDHILSNTKTRDLKVSVFTGPIFRDIDRKYRDILVPEDFWKIVALVDDTTGELSATAYVLSQRDFMDDLEFAFGEFKTYQVPITTIEEQTDLNFGSLRDFDPLARIETFSFRPLTVPGEIII